MLNKLIILALTFAGVLCASAVYAADAKRHFQFYNSSNKDKQEETQEALPEMVVPKAALPAQNVPAPTPRPRAFALESLVKTNNAGMRHIQSKKIEVPTKTAEPIEPVKAANEEGEENINIQNLSITDLLELVRQKALVEQKLTGGTDIAPEATEKKSEQENIEAPVVPVVPEAPEMPEPIKVEKPKRLYNIR